VPKATIPQAVKDYLLPHEKRVITVRRHPGQLALHAASLAWACTAASLITALTASGPLLLGAAWAACAVILTYLIVRGIGWLHAYVVVTEFRMIFIAGLTVRKVVTVPVREIDDVLLYRSPLARIIGYGTIILQPVRPGQRLPKMSYIPYPEQIFVEIAEPFLARK
jgi:membrane protein YdbS with pleckstrin-like domain